MTDTSYTHQNTIRVKFQLREEGKEPSFLSPGLREPRPGSIYHLERLGVRHTDLVWADADKRAWNQIRILSDVHTPTHVHRGIGADTVFSM